MELKEIILLYITITGFISYVPQIARLIKTKSADDCSISTWLMWVVNASLYLLYLYLENVNIWLKLTQLVEVVLISITALLIIVLRLIEYRRKRHEKWKTKTI